LPVIVKSPKIIERDLFETINNNLKSRALKNTQSKADYSPSILTGFLKCAQCGCNLVLVTGKSGKYVYYKCSKQVRSQVDICECPKIPKIKLEKLVIQAISDNLLIKERLLKITQELSYEIKHSFSDDRQNLLNLQKRHSTTSSKIDLLYRKVSEEILDLDETLQDHLNNLKSQRLTLKTEISELSQKLSIPIKKFGIRKIEAFVTASRKILLEENNEATKAYLKAFVSEITVSRHKVIIRGGKLRMVAGISQFESGHPYEGVPRLISNWRRGRDSNPRNAINVYTLSRRAPSATRPPLL
jgi:site-specific DNA recombinase